MALLMNTGEGYTQTGNGALTRWANAFSIFRIPVIGPLAIKFLGYGDTIIESAKYLFRGQFGSAATAAIAGTVSTTVNLAADTPLWWGLNAASGALTGATLGTHARKLTEGGIGAVTGALGMKPAVLRSYTAGIGSVGGMDMPPQAGRFTTQIANERGQDANALYAQKMGGDAGTYISPSLTGQAARA